MIEKPKRPKKIPNQDNKQPQTIEQLIKRYDLDNTKIYDFLDELVDYLQNTQQGAEIVVSSTEPARDNRSKVWFKKGKNLYYGSTSFGYVNDDGAWTSSTSSFTSNEYFEINPSTDYVVSFITSSTTILNVVAYYDENKILISRSIQSGVKTFTTPQNCKYIRLIFNKNNGTGDITNIQLEQGVTSTAYEGHIEAQIYVKNDNGVYENFI